MSPPVLLAAIRRDDVKEYDGLYETNNDRGLLCYAAKYGAIKYCRLLLDIGYNVNLGNPLGHAVEYGHSDVCAMLLAAGADPTALHYGWTPLQTAADKGATECCRLLLGAGAPHSTADNYGCTPLHYAAREGRSEICKLLLTARAAVSHRDLYGNTALYKAAKFRCATTCGVLLDAGANPNAVYTGNGTWSEAYAVDAYLAKLVAVRAVVAAHERTKNDALFSHIKHAVHK